MKPILLITFVVTILLTSCSKHQDHETTDDYPTVDEIGAGYLEQMKGLDDETLFPDRCDRLTFLSLASGFVNERNLAAYEYRPGEWHRDVRRCYPNDSRSEISFDGLIGVLHHAWTNNDRTLVDRLAAYGRANDWVMGEGDREFTCLPQIGVLIAEMKGAKSLTSNLAYSGSHREHILAVGIWLRGRYNGNLTSVELSTLKAMSDIPLAKALVARFTDGNQKDAIDYLSKYPNELPLDTGCEKWGGMPCWLYWYLIYAVVEGK